MGCSAQLAVEDLNYMDEFEKILKEKQQYINTLKKHNEQPTQEDKAKIAGLDIEITQLMNTLNKKFTKKGNKKQKKKYAKLLNEYQESLNEWRKFNGDSEDELQIQKDYENEKELGIDDSNENNNEEEIENDYDGFYDEDGRYPYLDKEL